jgi:hypothetical protein
MPKKYPSEQRDRATRMVLDRLRDYPRPWAAAQGLDLPREDTRLSPPLICPFLDAMRADGHGVARRSYRAWIPCPLVRGTEATPPCSTSSGTCGPADPGAGRCQRSSPDAAR